MLHFFLRLKRELSNPVEFAASREDTDCGESVGVSAFRRRSPTYINVMPSLISCNTEILRAGSKSRVEMALWAARFTARR
jgi:hypothetical protein